MYKKNVRLFSIFNFLIGFSLFAPLAIIYFSRVSGSYTLGATFSFYYSGKFLRKFKETNILLFKTIWGKCTGLIAFGIPTFISPFIMATGSLFYGVSQVVENKLMQAEFTDHQRATMSSLNSLGGSLGFALMSVVLGGLADAMGPAKALIILAILALPTTYLY